MKEKEKSQLLSSPKIQKSIDPVNPPWYRFGKFNLITVLEAIFPDDPHLFAAVQYLVRAHVKGNTIQDLEKAIWYIKRRLKLCREKESMQPK